MKTALLAVDLQNDFFEGGVLAARDTLALIEPFNGFVQASAAAGMLCVFTRDWHPSNHRSFRSQGGPWPEHCVRDSPGAAIHKAITVFEGAWIADKGTSPESVGYSDFEEPVLERRLRAAQISDLAVCGIATEYCVKANVLDALVRGFKVAVLEDLIRPIEAEPGDSAMALAEMRKAGAVVTRSGEFLYGLLQSSTSKETA